MMLPGINPTLRVKAPWPGVAYLRAGFCAAGHLDLGNVVWRA